MSTKVRTTTRYLLTEQLKMLGWSFAAIVLILFIIPFLFALVTGNISNYSLTGSISSLSFGGIFFIFFLFIFIIESLTYDNFKLLIQNGISRKTYWQARINTVILLSLLGTLVVFIYTDICQVFLTDISFNSSLLDSLAGPYVYFFGHNAIMGTLVGIIITWIFLIGTGLTGMACGSLLALFGKWTQRLLVIIVPTLGIFLLGYIMSASQHTTYHLGGLITFLKFIFGFPLHGTPKMGYLNPTMPVITMLLGCVIMGGLAYLFNRKLKVKN